jgi:hypothetical protein
MAESLPTGALQTFAGVGIRESLSDEITRISPTETPFYSMIRKGKTSSRSPEWQKDSLAAADGDNKQVEGYDVEGDTLTQPTRLKNFVQLQDKTIVVSDTMQAVDTAGRANELKYQVAKGGQELKRDMEAALTRNNASVAGNASTAGEIGGALAWLETNTDRDAGGSDGGFNTGTGLVDAAGNGSQRASSEAQLKNVIRQVWTEGGDPSVIMVGGYQKQQYSAFAGIATQYRDNPGRSMSRAVILGAADAYVSDFGNHRIIANRFSSQRDAYVLDPSKWECLFLQPFKTVPLGRNGHSERRLLKVEHTLCCKDEAANGVVADLATS